MLQEIIPDHKTGLHRLQYTREGKPYLPDVPFNFSSTHSGPLVLCAIQQDGFVGIDAEHVRPVPVDDLTCYFTADEQAKISGSANANHELLKLWSRKEAILKATGQGVFQAMEEVAVIKDTVRLNGRDYFLHTVDLDPGYVVHLATSEKDQEIQVIRFRM